MIRALVGRASWNLIDQVISSLGNGLLSVLVAHSVDSNAFGGFAVAFTIFTLLVGASRAVATSPLGIRFSDAPSDDFRRASSAATGAALALGALGGVGCLVAGGLAADSVKPGLIALGVIFPALIVQDAWRQVFCAAGRPAAAALNDAVWVVGELAILSAVLVSGRASTPLLILSWGISAIPAALLGVRQGRTWPNPWRAVTWLLEHRTLTGYMATVFVTSYGSYQAALLCIGTLGSLESIGALRGVQVLLSPTAVLSVAALSFAIPEFARRRSELTKRQWYAGALSVSAIVALLGLSWGMICELLPNSVGRALLGDTWVGTSDILWAGILGQFGSALAVGPVTMLFAMDRARTTLSVQIVFAPLIFVAATGGVLIADARGAAWGLCFAYWGILPWWIYHLHQQVLLRADRGAASVTCAQTEADRAYVADDRGAPSPRLKGEET
jgi:O-antigen/teichoic acid export membrane protein